MNLPEVMKSSFPSGTVPLVVLSLRKANNSALKMQLAYSGMYLQFL